MKGKKFNSPGHKPLILVAPLDWGLGHATRSIPIIKGLLQQDCEVIIAAEGQVRILLKKEFPGCVFLELKGYHMHYSRKAFWMPLVLLLQFPKILFTAYREHSWLKGVIKKYNIDAVISDSRLGLYHSAIPCIYLVHQLKIKTRFRFTEWLVQKFHYRFINKYTECWVPDAEEKTNLSGELSHPALLPRVTVKYIGPLSRFEKGLAEIKYDLLILLSGPEPQRTIFERMIFKDLETFEGKALLLRGLPEDTRIPSPRPSSVEIKNHLPSQELNRAILQSVMLISRAGYTTVMDLVKLQKPAILVPTPGQTEQEYLSRYLHQQGLFFILEQRSFSLPDALKGAAAFSFKKLAFSQEGYMGAIEDLIRSLQ